MQRTLRATSASGSALNRHRSHRLRETRSAVRDVRERLNSATGTRPDFDYELIMLFVRNRLGAAWALPTFTILIGLGAGLLSSMVLGVLWTVMTLFGQGLILYLCKEFMQYDPDEVDVKLWTARFIGAECYSGFSWATLSVLLMLAHSSPQIEILLFATMLVIIAIGAMLSNSLPKATLASTVPIAVTLAISFGLKADILHFAMASVTLGAELFFLFIAQRMHETNIAVLEARAEKDVLIAELEQQRGIAEDARRRAEEGNLAKSRFLATMSHELRTPLNAILGFSEVMTSEAFGPLPNQHYKDYAYDIYRSGKHLLNLINEILDLSRIEAGRHELREESILLAHCVEDAVHLLNMKARNKSITIVENYAEDLPRLWADERAIRQITLNVLSNAIKFTPSGGDIFMRVGWTTDGGQYLAIRDTGPGIPEEEIPVVLSNFGQGSLAIKSAEQGTGLGLPIVQALVKMHGGTFNLDSKLRQGTEIVCTFPPGRVMEVMPKVGNPEAA
jgi:two-component system cell cycle sensor histidine kinase PleC